VMAGVPSITRGLLEDVGHRLEGGVVVRSRTIRGKGVREGAIAQGLAELEAATDGVVSFGSYPWFAPPDSFGVHLVARSADLAALEKAAADLMAMIRSCGAEPEEVVEA
jgi:molybdopterin-biosynthesis enzyme MoeA-like protein